METTIKIPKQNDFTLAFPFVERTFVDGKAVDTPLDLSLYTDMRIMVESQDGTYQADYEGTKDGNTLYVNFEETLPINTYNVIISGKYNGKDKTSLLKRCFAIVQWNQQSNWTDYIAGSPILMPTSVFVTGGSNASGMKTLVINVPLEDLERIISSSKTEDGFPDEYLVNADLGFGMNEINAFIEGKLNVKLMTNLKGVLSDDDWIFTMTLDNVTVQEIPKKQNILLNGERVIYGIVLTYDRAFTFKFALSEHYCTAIVEEIGIPDYSNAIAQAQQTEDEAKQIAKEAFEATQVTDPTNGSYPTTINEALSNVYNNLNDKIMQDDDGLAFALLLMSQVVRDFTADISLIGDGKCISISSSEIYNVMLELNDALFNEMYLTFKSGENIDAGNIFTNYAYENTSRKVTLKFGGETLPTFKMTNVAYPDYNLDIIIDNIHVRQMIEILLGVSNVVALRMLEAPLTVGDNNDSCYWALVTEDGTVHNPGTY